MGQDLVANLPARDVSGPSGQSVPNGAAAGGMATGTEPNLGLDPDAIKRLQQLQQLASQPHRQIAPPEVSPKFKSGNLGANIAQSALSMFVPFVGSAVQRSVKASRETQIVEVMNKLGVINQELEMAQYLSNGDQQKMQEYLQKSSTDPNGALYALFHGPESKKFQKGMMKVFGTDLLNPEKQNTIYHDAMKRHTKLSQAAGQVKDLFHRHQQAQQQQAQGQQQQGQQGGQPQQGQQQANPADQIMRMPQKITPPDMRGTQEMATAVHSTVQAMMETEPKTDYQAWYRASTKENGHTPTTAEQRAHRDEWRLQPIQQMAEEAYQQFQQDGDMQAFEQKLGLVHKFSDALKATPRKNWLDVMQGALKGNPDDKELYAKQFHDQMAMRMAYGRGRAMYQFHNYLGPDGQQHWHDAVTVRDMMMRGENPGVPLGQMTPKDVGSLQRIQQDLAPKGSPYYDKGAFKKAYDNIATFDSGKDRAIFAQIMRDGQDQLKLGIINIPEFVENVFDQALTKNLSEEGRNYSVVARRIAEGLGAVRNVYNLPSTNSSMQLLMALVPGATAPDSNYARKALDELGYTVQYSYSLPVYAGATGQAPKKQSLGDYLDTLKKKQGAPK